MAMTLDGSNGVTFNDASLQGAAASPFGLKNRLINADMRIDQRNAGASVTPANSYTLDRWQGVVSQTGKFTVQQNAGSVTPPSGYKNYLGVTSSSAYSVLTGDYFMISQRIEGYNFADLMFGTASAQTFTFSFWVRSSLTGTFGGSFQGAASATLRSYPFSYTISSANTWEQKTITVAGDTFTNTWDSTNGIGLFVNFGLGAGASASGTAGTWASANYANATGATSVVGTNGATFYITGVQLEVGSTATPFERRMYGTELALCQRYYTKFGAGYAYTSYGSGYASSATGSIVHISYPTAMRTQPTSSLSGSNRLVFSGGSVVVSGFNLGATGILNGYFTFTSSGMTTNLPCIVGPNGDSTAYLDLSAEL
jgi:hypothetical protein